MGRLRRGLLTLSAAALLVFAGAMMVQASSGAEALPLAAQAQAGWQVC